MRTFMTRFFVFRGNINRDKSNFVRGRKSKMQTSESFRLSAILSFSGGLQDAYTYEEMCLQTHKPVMLFL